MKKQQSGFTLIELMIVVAIIGILASVSIPMYRDYIVRTKVATALTTVSNIKTALTITNNEGGSWVAMTEAAADLPKWQNIGMRLPDVSLMPEITGIAVDAAGEITIKLDKDITGVNDSTIVLTPSFNGAVTTWSSKFNKGSLTDVDTEALIKTYLERNANGS